MAQLIYGKNTIREILQQGKIKKLYLTKNHEDIKAEAQKVGLSVVVVDKGKLDKLCGPVNHQGIAAEIEDYKTYSVEDILADIPSGELGVLVVLDELEDPHNLGAILRSACATGVHGVIIKKRHAAGLTPTVAKVSAGAIEHVKVAEVTNITQCLKLLKEKGYWVAGAAKEKQAQDYRYPAYDTPLALVIGNEGKGISRLVKETCDFFVALPMQGKVESLNASVACGVLLYEIYSKRFPL
ncbi:MAG: 23S rRNA (guanosine(2251)-2'-O)-methyltransferase RlmB [Anaerorhabdus sp.]